MRRETGRHREENPDSCPTEATARPVDADEQKVQHSIKIFLIVGVTAETRVFQWYSSEMAPFQVELDGLPRESNQFLSSFHSFICVFILFQLIFTTVIVAVIVAVVVAVVVAVLE